MDNNIVYIAAFLDKDKAESFRERALEHAKELPFEYYIVEDDIKFINSHYQVRILIEPKQKSFLLEETF